VLLEGSRRCDGRCHTDDRLNVRVVAGASKGERAIQGVGVSQRQVRHPVGGRALSEFYD
jgi:hypothetical protein